MEAARTAASLSSRLNLQLIHEYMTVGVACHAHVRCVVFRLFRESTSPQNPVAELQVHLTDQCYVLRWSPTALRHEQRNMRRHHGRALGGPRRHSACTAALARGGRHAPSWGGAHRWRWERQAVCSRHALRGHCHLGRSSQLAPGR
eukprot:scaffold76461_cov63-Phaeocystis_antarctica.AAC.5